MKQYTGKARPLPGLYGRTVKFPLAYCRLKDVYLVQSEIAEHKCRWKGKDYRKPCCRHYVTLETTRERRLGLDDDTIARYNEWRISYTAWKADRNAKRRAQGTAGEGTPGFDQPSEGLAGGSGVESSCGADEEAEGSGLVPEEEQA